MTTPAVAGGGRYEIQREGTGIAADSGREIELEGLAGRHRVYALT